VTGELRARPLRLAVPRSRSVQAGSESTDGAGWSWRREVKPAFDGTSSLIDAIVGKLYTGSACAFQARLIPQPARVGQRQPER
jgi:hypothetical protein